MDANARDSALAECLALLESGATLEECLARYPHLDGLADLLHLALGIRAAPHPEPDPKWFAASRRRLEQAAERKPERLLSAIGPAAVLVWAWRWPLASSAASAPPLAALRVAAVLAVLALAGNSTVDAARASTPGTPLYAVRIAAEEARVATTFDAAGRAVLHLQRANVRLDELERAQTSARTQGVASLALAAQAELHAALADLQTAPEDQRPRATALLDALSRREVTLRGVVEHAADHAVRLQGVTVILDDASTERALAHQGARIAVQAALRADGRFHAVRVLTLPPGELDGLRSQRRGRVPAADRLQRQASSVAASHRET